MLESKLNEHDLTNLLVDLPKQIEKLNKISKIVLTDAVLLGESLHQPLKRKIEFD